VSVFGATTLSLSNPCNAANSCCLLSVVLVVDWQAQALTNEGQYSPQQTAEKSASVRYAHSLWATLAVSWV